LTDLPARAVGDTVRVSDRLVELGGEREVTRILLARVAGDAGAKRDIGRIRDEEYE